MNECEYMCMSMSVCVCTCICSLLSLCRSLSPTRTSFGGKAGVWLPGDSHTRGDFVSESPVPGLDAQEVPSMTQPLLLAQGHGDL